MVKACQMQDAVEGENLDFNGWGMSEPGGILCGNVGGDRDIARETGALNVFLGRTLGRKRQDIRGFVFASKAAIQRTNCGAVGHQNIDGAAQSGAAAGARHKARECRLTQICDFFLQNHHAAFYRPL
jgi:hypothetical protein